MNTQFVTKVRITLASLVFVGGALTATSHAQMNGKTVQVTIPFAFQEASAHLNPGIYTLSVPQDNILMIHGPRGSASAMALVGHGETLQPADVGKVVFHKYGDLYFLREIWVKGSSTHLVCPASKAEKSLQRERQLASNHRESNGTEVALLEQPR